MCVYDMFLGGEKWIFPFVIPASAAVPGGGSASVVALAILLAAFIVAFLYLYRAPGIGKSGKDKFMAYTASAIFIIILGIAGSTYSTLPFIGQFGGLISLVAIVIALILGILIYITYRNELDFAKEVELQRKELEQRISSIETDIYKIQQGLFERDKESGKRLEEVEELLERYRKREKENR